MAAEFRLNICPIDPSRKMGFEEQNDEGFRLGMAKGIDLSSACPVFWPESANASPKAAQTNLGSMGSGLARLASGYAKAGAKRLLPRDVWHLGVYLCRYRHRLLSGLVLLGKKPLESTVELKWALRLRKPGITRAWCCSQTLTFGNSFGKKNTECNLILYQPGICFCPN